MKPREMRNETCERWGCAGCGALYHLTEKALIERYAEYLIQLHNDKKYVGYRGDE